MKHIILILLCLPTLSLAAEVKSYEWGLKLHYGHYSLLDNAMTKPPETYTTGAAVVFIPAHWKWREVSLYLQSGYDYWHSNYTSAHRSLYDIYIAPVIHVSFFKRAIFSPYLEVSAGPAYMSETRLANRNLGIHYTFRDMLGVGFSFGSEKNCNFSIQFLHNSNASISKHNAGVNVWPTFSLGYIF